MKKKLYFSGGSMVSNATQLGMGAATGDVGSMVTGGLGMFKDQMEVSKNANSGFESIASLLNPGAAFVIGKQQEMMNNAQGKSDIAARNQMMGFANGGSLTEFNGNLHEQGGIQLTNNAEVEGGETKNDDYIFSDRLLNPLTGNTFAKDSKKFNEYSEERPNDPIANRTFKVNIEALKKGNELIKQQKEAAETMEMRCGGKLYYKGGKIMEGDYDLDDISPDEIEYLESQGFDVSVEDSQDFFEDGGQVITTPIENNADDPQTMFVNNWLNNRKTQLQNNINLTNPSLQVQPELDRQYNNMLNTRYEVGDVDFGINGLFSREGVYDEQGNISDPNPYIRVKPSRDNTSTEVHEKVHSLLANPQEQAIKSFIDKGDVNLDTLGIHSEYGKDMIPYLSNPREIYSRMMEARYNSNLQPDQKLKRKDLKNIKSTMRKNNNELLDMFDDKSLLKLFNDIAYAQPNKNNINIKNEPRYLEDGGSLYDISPKLDTLNNSGIFLNNSIPNSKPTSINQYDYTKGVPNDLLLAQAYKESTFNPSATSPAGAIGLTQVTPETVEYYTNKTGIKVNPNNPEDAVKIQKYLMDDLYNASFNKKEQLPEVRMAKTLAAYNWGRGNLSKFLSAKKKAGVDIYNSLDWIDELPEETNDYINKLLLKKNNKFNKEFETAKNNKKYKDIVNLYS